MNLKDTYNKIAEDWYHEVLVYKWWEAVTKKFMSFLKKGDSILDIGCGPGITSNLFIENGFKVLGIDFSEKMIEIAKNKVPEGSFLTLDLKDINKLKDSFDAIYMKAVLLHIPKRDVGEKLENVAKLLKKGGYLYIAVKEKRPNGVEEEIKVDNDYGYKVEIFFSYFTQEEIKLYLERLNFKVVFFEITNYVSTKWIQVIGKKIS